MDSFHLLVFYVVDLIELINNKLTRPKFILRLCMLLRMCVDNIGVSGVRSALP